MALGFYKIIGWNRVKDSGGWDAKPPEEFVSGETRRSLIRTLYKKFCYSVEDPALIKVEYYYGTRNPMDITEDFRFPELAGLKSDRGQGIKS